MFRNRGEVPNIDIGQDNGNGGYGVPHYSHYWRRYGYYRYYIIHYDKTFIAMELISAFLIILIAVAVYLFAYQITFYDPIAETKTTFLTFQLISILATVILAGLITILSKQKETIIKGLKLVGIMSLLIVLIHLGSKIYLDSQYNEETFGEFYETYEQGNTDSKRLTIGLSGIQYLDDKEAYIEESVNAYTNFKVKTILYMVIYCITICIIFYLAHRLENMEDKKEELYKDDAVLFDEEENIKF